MDSSVASENSEPKLLGPKDAIVIPEGERDAASANSRWAALTTFHHAPCLWSSLGQGFAGGVGIAGLRHFTGSNKQAVFTWGCTVAGLLAGTSWFFCRRKMYSSALEEVSLLQRVANQEPGALDEYRALRKRLDAEKARADQDP